MKKTAKKLTAILLVLTLVFSFAGITGVDFVPKVQAGGDSEVEEYERFTDGDFLYTIIDNKAMIIGYTGNKDGEIIIPSKLGGYDVKIIKSGFGYSKITSVIVPEGIEEIRDYAFKECKKLTNVVLPESLKYNESSAYRNPFDITSYISAGYWENGLFYIGKHLIGCSEDATGDIVIKPGTLTIAGSAFWNNDSITSVTIPDSIKGIGARAFSNCDNLKSITIADGVKGICTEAFFETSYYNNSDNWENGALYVGKHLIKVNDSVKGHFEIKKGTVEIASEAFLWCSNITSVEIPDSVENIGIRSFVGCDSITSFVIPYGVENIERETFDGCTSVEFIHVPETVSEIYGTYYNGYRYSETIENNAIICSAKENCYAKTYADANEIEFRICDGIHSVPVAPPGVPDVPEEPSDNKITGTMENLGMTYEYEYSDEFFENSSYEYNHDLATMSICLAISAMVEKGSYNGDEPEAAKKLMEEIGYGDNLTPCNYDTEPEQDSIACIIGSKNIPETDETVIAIAIRGAGYGNEWAGNFNLGSNITHNGFKKAKNKVMSYLCSFIEENKETFNGSVKYWVTGFSRSAATANLVAAELDEIAENHDVGFVEWWNGWETIADLNFEPSDVYAYTFETPMNTTSDDTGDKLYKNIFNIINRNDLVPYVAPSEWGYDRFGMDCKLPSAEKTDNYKDFKDRMSESYEKITNGLTYEEEFQYFEIYKDWEEWHSPILEMRENKSMYQSAFLDEFVGVLAYDIIGSRETYIDKYEASVMELAEFLMGTKGYEWNFNFHDFLENLWESIKDKWLSLAFDLVTGSYLKGIVSSALSAACGNVDLSASDIYDVLDELDGIFEGLASNFDTTYTLMVNAVKTVPTTEKHEDGDGESRLMYTHHPSICLAWMDAIDGELVEVEFSDIKMLEDDVYSILGKFGIPSDIKKLEEKVDYLLNDSPYLLTWQERIVLEQYKQESQITRTYRKVIFNCPVKINVYDKSGALRASVVDDIVQYVPDGYISTYINPDGEKVFCLPNDGEYTFEITGTDSGMLNCSVVDFDADLRQNVTGSNYYNIPVENGTQIAGSIEVRTSEDLKSKSNFEFADGTDIPVSEVIDYTTEEEYTVTVESDGENGNVSGGGKYYRGEFAKVIAYNADGHDFLGWYVDGELISTENQYRFCVMEDIGLTAKYIEKSDEQKPEEPTEKPKEITVDIRTPSTTIINYGDSIWLHAEINGNLPANAKIIWTPSNNNFEIVEVSADGLSCKITPTSNGTTTFTVSVVDANEKVLSTDTQDMTAKAGLWQKIVAFFKKIFGLTKTYPELFKILY